MPTFACEIEDGAAAHAEMISALAIQVFLDTYATEGVRPDLAAEAFAEYSKERFVERLEEPGRLFLLARQADGLVGFAECLVGARRLPGQDLAGAELVRLYVQPRFHGRGIGRALLAASERRVLGQAGTLLWLTVWEGNDRALAFYRASGFREAGATTYEFQGRVYGNKLMSKELVPAPGGD